MKDLLQQAAQVIREGRTIVRPHHAANGALTHRIYIKLGRAELIHSGPFFWFLFPAHSGRKTQEQVAQFPIGCGLAQAWEERMEHDAEVHA